MPRSAPATILFVDDDPIARRALMWLFRDAGFNVLEAATGQDALRLIHQRPDLVVLDINLPDIDGFEVCRRIKDHPDTRSISVLHVSALFVESSDRSHGLEGGADAYLVKPVEPREILATVRALLRIRAAEEAARAAAQEWRSTFDAISDLVRLLGPDGLIRRCNRALTELVGRPFRDLLGQPLARTLREGLGLDHDPPIVPCAGAGAERSTQQVQLGTRWFRASADPILDENGHCSGSVHTFTDITVRKELEEQLRQGQKLEAIGRLAGGVAHDFNNLLTVVLGNTSLLLSAGAAGPDQEVLRTIERAAWRAAELTRQLLGFSRQTLLWLKPTNLREPLTEVARMLERTLPANVTLQIKQAPDLWTVQADPGQITQVLLNLCVNAIDAMPNGGRLTLEPGNREIDEAQARGNLEARVGAFACLSVCDTGGGIPAEVLPRIFDPFFTTKPTGQGTGLGLAMVYGIVKQHQGWVECHTRLGEGTRFDIYLPRAQADAGGTTASSGGLGQAEMILVASDNDLLRPLTATLLRHNGFQVRLADDGPSAVEAFRQQPERFGLVFLDLAVTREQTLKQLREISPQVRTLLADDVGRPYRESSLIQAVRAVLDRPSL